MKKLTFFLSLALVAVMSSCTAQGQGTQLKSEVDTLSYTIGMARIEGLDQYLLQSGVDSTLMADFLKGFREGTSSYSAKDRAYTLGVQTGQMVSHNWVEALNQQLFGTDSTKTINRELMIQGFIDGVTKKEGTIDMTTAQTIASAKMQEIQDKVLNERYADNKAAGEQFLAENKSKEGVITTESGLQYKVITMGSGEKPEASSQVKVNYRGTLIDGTEFDSSYSRNEPATFRVGQVISGWSEALQLMPVGSKFELYIPQELAYGSRDMGGDIKPFSALIFEVELLEIVK